MLRETNFLFNCSSRFLTNMSTECLDPKRNIWGVENICTPFTWNLRHAAGVWCIINAVVGFAGNLLTILAIPYACWKRK